MRQVIVYTQPGWGPCHAEKAWLSQNGIGFEERDIRANPEWLQEIVALGARGTPATALESDAGREVVVGFDRGRLARILGL